MSDVTIVKILTRPTLEELETAINVLRFFRDEEMQLEEHSTCNTNLDIEIRDIKVFLENQRDRFIDLV